MSALRWPLLVMGEPRREGPPHLPTFTCSARIAPPGAEAPMAASADGRSVKLAQYRAAVALLALLAEVSAPSFDRIPPRVVAPKTSGKARPLPAESDPIAWLHTHASRFHMKQPRFTHARLLNGEHHVVVRYTGLVAEGCAESKLAAKREACAKMKGLVLAGPQDEALGAQPHSPLTPHPARSAPVAGRAGPEL